MWSEIKGIQALFFRDFLGISTARYPAPSDITLNPNYEIVNIHYTLQEKGVNKIEEDRVDSAIIDVFFDFLNDHKASGGKYLVALESLGNDPLTDEQLSALIAALEKNGVAVPAETSTALANRPKEISTKQLLFFAFLNNYLTPKVRKAIQPGIFLAPKALRDRVSILVENELNQARQQVEAVLKH